MDRLLPKVYDPKTVEEKWYRFWLEYDYFHAEVDAKAKPYALVIPPPNVTGKLHLGHALNNTLQDILVRYHRMKGENAMWIPGTDHAGIATQVKVEEELAKHPKIAEVSVVSTPNPVLGESICVCVIPRPGQTINLDEIRGYLQDKIARNKLPDELCLMEEFPRLSGGVKLNKYGKGGIQELAQADTAREVHWKKKKRA